MNTLIKLTENDKRLIIVALLVFILLFVLVGYISLLVKKIMTSQGSKADEMLANVVKAEMFDKENKLVKFGIKKNINVFYKEARIPFIIIFVAWISYVLFCLFTGKWGYNPLNRTDGFATILFELGEWPKTQFFHIRIINGWPEVVTKPRFEWRAIFSYFFVPANIVGIFWFLLCTQAYIARSFKVRKIAKGIFRKKLVPDEAPTQTEIKPE